MSTTIKTFYTLDGEEIEREVSEAQGMEMRRALEVLQFMPGIDSASNRKKQIEKHHDYLIYTVGILLENEEQNRILCEAIGAAIVSSHYYLDLEKSRKHRVSEYEKALRRKAANIKYNNRVGNYEEVDRLESHVITKPVLAGELHKFDMMMIELALLSEFDLSSTKRILIILKKIAKATNYTEHTII